MVVRGTFLCFDIFNFERLGFAAKVLWFFKCFLKVTT
jgi:hypothetical protein